MTSPIFAAPARKTCCLIDSSNLSNPGSASPVSFVPISTTGNLRHHQDQFPHCLGRFQRRAFNLIGMCSVYDSHGRKNPCDVINRDASRNLGLSSGSSQELPSGQGFYRRPQSGEGCPALSDYTCGRILSST